MKNAREEARAWLQRILETTFEGNTALSAEELRDYGDSVYAIGEQYDIPDEAVHFWLEDHHGRKDYSLVAFRAWCESYAALARQLPPEAAGVPRRAALRLCERCYANLLQQTAEGGWWCQKCGQVTA